MKILAFESTCDETAVAVVEDGRKVLSDAIASQADLHALYGGVVPEIASRKHVECIAALTEQALQEAGCTRQDIDAVAVSYAPGLIGAVLVGLSFAKSVAFGLGVPLIPVHHIRGHIAANYLAFPDLKPPFSNRRNSCPAAHHPHWNEVACKHRRETAVPACPWAHHRDRAIPAHGQPYQSIRRPHRRR